jgi:ribonuclease E
MGIVVRTEAEGMAEEAIMEDLEALQKQWEVILQEAGSTRAPALLNRDDDFIQRVLRDTYNSDVNRIVVDSNTGLKRVKQHLVSWSGGKTPQGVLVDHHKESTSILEYFRVNAAIREALQPRVDLPSGGYIIIERTEALTVIDVNSGSFTKSATARETVLWTNYEAATEIARQLRLRNIAGVIIVDFIDMDARRDQLQLLEHFNKSLRADKSRPQIAQLTELGLVELTRKRQGQNIYELFGRACSTCGGLGHLAALPGQKELDEATPLTTSRNSDYRTDEAYDARPSASEPPREVAVRSRSRFSSLNRNEGRSGRGPEPTTSVPRELPWTSRSQPSADIESEPLEPDFLHHPSYNERGGANRRRRRRRPGEVTRPPGFGEGRDGFRDRDSEPAADLEQPISWEDADRSSIEPDPFAGAEDFSSTVSKKGRPERHRTPKRGTNTTPPERGERTERGERGVPLGRLPSEPREVIPVEMTAEEQEVYAWMGVSPLVLAHNTEAKNPRSVFVAVTLPGQPVDMDALSEQVGGGGSALILPSRERDTPESADDEEVKLPESDEADNYFEPPKQVTTLPPIPVSRAVEASSQSRPEDSFSPGSVSMPDASESEEPSINRRRRRRSSAATD